MSPELLERKTIEHIECPDRAYNYFKDKLTFEMDPELLLKKLYDDNVRIFDVREHEDFVEYHIPGAVSITLSELRENIEKFRDDKVNIVYSYDTTCIGAVKAALILAEHKCKVATLCGGFKYWTKRSFPIDSM